MWDDVGLMTVPFSLASYPSFLRFWAGRVFNVCLGFWLHVDVQVIRISRSRVRVCPKRALPFQSRVRERHGLTGSARCAMIVKVPSTGTIIIIEVP